MEIQETTNTKHEKNNLWKLEETPVFINGPKWPDKEYTQLYLLLDQNGPIKRPLYLLSGQNSKIESKKDPRPSTCLFYFV